MANFYLIPFIVILCILLAVIIVRRIKTSKGKKQIYFSVLASVFCFPAITPGSIPIPLIYLFIAILMAGNNISRAFSEISQEWLINIIAFLAMAFAMHILSYFMNLETPTNKDEEE